MDAGSWTQEEAVEFLQSVDRSLLRNAASLLEAQHKVESGQEIRDLADVIDSFNWDRLLAEHVETLKAVPNVEADEEWLGTISGRTRVYFDLERFPEPPPLAPWWDWYYDEPEDSDFEMSGGHIPYDEFEDEYEVGW